MKTAKNCVKEETPMTKKISYVFVSLALLLAVATTQSQAGFYLGVQAGYSAQKPSLSDVEFNTNTTFLYGARFGINLLMFAVEANYFQAAHDLELSQFATFDWGGRSIDYNFIGLNFKYFFPLLLLQPYLSVGFGYYTADIQAIDKDTSSGYNLGLGVEMKLGKRLALLAEGRYHVVKLDIDQRELKLGNFAITGGLNFYF